MQAGARVGMAFGAVCVLGAAACGVGEITTYSLDLDAPAGQPDARAGQPDARTGPPDAPAGQPDAPAGQPDAPPTGGGPGPLKGTFELTYYYVAAEADYANTGDDTTLYEPGCSVLATVPTTFADAVVIEGTGELKDGRVFNYAGSCACAFSPCFEFVDENHPWGSGAQGRPLVPFRSIAVDTRVLVIGERYYVAELDGILMPGAAPTGGFLHDGCVTADDTGGHILGMHIDFFSALRAYYMSLDDELQLNDITLYDGGDKCP